MHFVWQKLLGHEIFRSMVLWVTFFFKKCEKPSGLFSYMLNVGPLNLSLFFYLINLLPIPPPFSTKQFSETWLCISCLVFYFYESQSKCLYINHPKAELLISENYSLSSSLHPDVFYIFSGLRKNNGVYSKKSEKKVCLF